MFQYKRKPTPPGEILREEFLIPLRITQKQLADLIVEVKAVSGITPIHHAQLTSYLKLSRCKVGLLINFNVMMLKDGITRIVNNF